MQLELNLQELKREVNKIRPKTIFIQLPEGLKTKSNEIRLALIEYETFFSIEPVYGACDTQNDFAEKINADLSIHFGHTEFINSTKKIIYWPTYYVFEPDEIKDVVRKIEAKFTHKNVALISPIQYNKAVNEIKKMLDLKSKVKTVVCAETDRIKKGQVLGCDISTIVPIIKDVDFVVYIGDGIFHPNAFVNFPINKKIFWVLPGREIKEFEIKRDEIRRQEMMKFIVKDKNLFGVFVSRKEGQFGLSVAEKVKEILEKNDKEVFMLIGDNLSNEKMLGFNVEVVVNTACPRIIDDYRNYKPLVVNPNIIFDAFKKK